MYREMTSTIAATDQDTSGDPDSDASKAAMVSKWEQPLQLFMDENGLDQDHGFNPNWYKFTSLDDKAVLCKAFATMVGTDGADRAEGAAVPGEDAYMLFRAIMISLALDVTHRASDMASLENFIWDPGGYAVMPIDSSVIKPKRNTFVLDLCSGTCAASVFHIGRNNSTIAIAVDLYKDRQWSVRFIPEPQRARFVHLQMDVTKITLSFVITMLKSYSADLLDLEAIYYSPCCRTMSRASRNRPPRR